MNNQTLYVRIVSPQQTLFQGYVLSVSSKNSAGTFDILPYHASFITIIENKPIKLVTAEKKPLIFNFPLVIIQNSQNKVNIYTYTQPSLEKSS